MSSQWVSSNSYFCSLGPVSLTSVELTSVISYIRKSDQDSCKLNYDIRWRVYLFLRQDREAYGWLCQLKTNCWTLGTGMEKRAFVSSRAIYQVIRGVFTGSNNYNTSVIVAATEVATWFSLWQSTVILQDPSVFCTDQTGELKGDVVEITTPSILQVFLIALIFAVPKMGNAKKMLKLLHNCTHLTC